MVLQRNGVAEQVLPHDGAEDLRQVPVVGAAGPRRRKAGPTRPGVVRRRLAAPASSGSHSG